ncbi:MAG: hypothetical protein JWN74_1519 [Acidobacteriaceae bacterium]|nr:hypothetical protein [Acidobacteriaceae bacterium]
MPRRPPTEKQRPEPFRMYLVPCSCGTTFAVSDNYDRRGTGRTRYLICPNCKKPHDPKNRLLELGYQADGYWKVDKC